MYEMAHAAEAGLLSTVSSLSAEAWRSGDPYLTWRRNSWLHGRDSRSYRSRLCVRKGPHEDISRIGRLDAHSIPVGDPNARFSFDIAWSPFAFYRSRRSRQHA